MNEQQNTPVANVPQTPQVQTPPQPESSTLSIVGFVLSLIGFLLTLSFIGMILGIPMMFAGFIIGIVALSKKNKKKGLAITAIVIPVISPFIALVGGVFFAASLPRFLGSHDAALDIARKSALTDVNYALEMYFSHNGYYPKAGDSVADLQNALIEENDFLNSIPRDPNEDQEAIRVGNQKGEKGNYTYALLKSDKEENGGYALVSKVSRIENANATKAMVESWTPNVKNSDITLCTEITKDGEGECSVSNLDDLRYAIIH